MPTNPSRIRFRNYRQAVRQRDQGGDAAALSPDLATEPQGGPATHGHGVGGHGMGGHGHGMGGHAAAMGGPATGHSRGRGTSPSHTKPPSASHGQRDLDSGSKSATRQRSFLQLLREFWGLLGNHRRSVLFALTLLTFSIALKLIPPYATKLAIDSVLTKPPKPLPDIAARAIDSLPGGEAIVASPMRLLVTIAIAVTIVTLICTVLGLWARWTATLAVNRSQVSIRRKVYDHMLQLPLQRVQGLKSGGIASLIREDAGGISELIFNMLYNPWRAIVQFLGSLIILVLVDWKLMVGGLLLLPMVWLSHRTWINRIRPLFRDVRKQRQLIDAAATETFGGIRVVRTFARWRNESSRFVREGDFLVRQQLYTWWWTRTIELVWEVLLPLASTLLLVYGGYQIIHGELTLGELMMFLVYLTMLLDPLATLTASAVSFQTNLAALDRVLDVLAYPREFPDNPAAVRISRPATRGEFDLRDVRFNYPGSDAEVLRGIDLHVEPGETVALVGRSGSGKTTLTNLIARFYDPTSGSILLDGRDLRDIEPQSFRKLLGIVEQDVFLFDGTIGENIAYSRPDASDDEIAAAAKAAAADEFILSLPDGFDTLIGERGFKLSGGQRQRIAIARAILADPKILILDEATSNLDSHSERLIQQSLAELLRGRTAFVIAHRLSTIRNADKIVVIQEGRIVQVGDHDSLLNQPGGYRDMLRLQTDPDPDLAFASSEEVSAQPHRIG